MRFALACVAAISIVLAARAARPSCDNGGLSEGYGECQAHPGCECQAVTKTCPNGGWYTQYSVDLTKCVGAGSSATPTDTTPKQPAPSPTPRLPPKKPKGTPCEMMQRWLDAEKRVLAAYQNDSILDQAIREGWSSYQYDSAIYEAVNGEPPNEDDGIAVMWTDMRRCKIQNVKEGCDWLMSKGLPPAACKIALDHEKVHEQQCKHRIAGYKPGDQRQRRDRETQAHQQTIDEIQRYLDQSCGPVSLR
ncbi:MAG TPA: hypothetical protein VL463_10750 [Kofleriaceae bacterium]|jgi:hypothetical protein|nr:hypothetical protein [Kofleriaceae bacterium]